MNQPFIETYDVLRDSLWNQLSPDGVLECVFAGEIVSAVWRLRRCLLMESELLHGDLTPAQVEIRQKSIDQSRALSIRLLRQSTSELRKLQTESALRAQLHREGLGIEPNAGLIDIRQFIGTVKLWADSSVALKQRLYLVEKSVDNPLVEPGSSFCKKSAATPQETKSTPKSTPRNAHCPCNSGQKFKRCCGKSAPPVLNMAA